MKILKKSEIKMLDKDSNCLESTILVLAKKSSTYIIYDICGEDIQADGDGDYHEISNFDKALKLFNKIVLELKETYKDISGYSEVINYE